VEQLIAYYSKNGTTKSTVKKIKGVAKNNVDYVDLGKNTHINLSLYKKIYVGTGIYAGTIPKPVKKFLSNSELKNKEVAFFIHGLDSEKSHKSIIKNSIRESNWIDLCDFYYLGGQLDMKEQNILVKQVLKVIAKKKNLDINNMCNLKNKEIIDFVNFFKD